MAEEVMEERKPMVDWPAGKKIESSGGGSGEYADYVKLDPGDPIKAHVTAVKAGTKAFKGEEQNRMFVWFKLDEGPGIGQVYRGDFNPKLTSPDSPKQSNLAKFAALLYGAPQSELDPTDMIGRPIRVLLSAEWGDKKLQFADTYVKPALDQKRVKVENTLTAEDIAEVFEGEVVTDD